MKMLAVAPWLTTQFLTVALLGLLTSWATAEEQELLFEEDFSLLDSAFKQSDVTTCSVEQNQLKLAIKKEYQGYLGIYPNVEFIDADISTQVRLENPTGKVESMAGLVFWAKDTSEYYAVRISDLQTVSVVRLYNRQWSYPLSWRASDLIKTGPEDWNELRVVTVKNRAVVYLNGTKLVTFRGQPVESGSKFGLYSASGTADSVVLYKNLRVHSPTAADSVFTPEEADPNLLYVDRFESLDPGWGLESSSVSVKDSKLVLNGEPTVSLRQSYSGFLAREIDLTVNVLVQDHAPQIRSNAGVVFWDRIGEELDYYMFNIADDRTFYAYWMKSGEWKEVIAPTAIPAEANFDPEQPAQLRVIAKSNRAIFSINGVNVGVVSRSPLKSDCRFGLVVGSGTEPATAQFSDLVVRKPETAKP